MEWFAGVDHRIAAPPFPDTISRRNDIRAGGLSLSKGETEELIAPGKLSPLQSHLDLEESALFLRLFFVIDLLHIFFDIVLDLARRFPELTQTLP